jgi:VWFA-related protein
MLEHRPPGRRRIILMIAEKRDRGSSVKLPEVMEQVQRLNAEVFWITFSPFLQPWTVKPKTVEDTKPEAERDKENPDNTAVPADLGAGDPYYGLGELVHLRQPDLAGLFTKNTGGRTLSFLKKNGLEQAIQLIGEEVHRQYILSFQPKQTDPGAFHTIRVVVKNRAGYKAKTREGYWSLQ